jgi:hypothetical protein
VEEKGRRGAHGLDRHVVEIEDLPKQRQLPVHEPVVHGPEEAYFLMSGHGREHQS